MYSECLNIGIEDRYISFGKMTFHGIHDDCHGWMKEVAVNITKQTGAYSECLNIGIEDKYISIFESMKSQAEQECKKIIKHPVFG